MSNRNKILKFSFLVAILLGSFLINTSASAVNYVCLCKGYDPASVTNQQKIVNTCASSNLNSSFVYPCEAHCRGKENINSCIPETIAAPAQIGGPTIAVATTGPKFKLPDYVFQIPIDTLTHLQIVDCSNGDMCNIPFLAQYIAAVYKYGLSIAGILGVLMLMAAGLLWIVSGGDSGKINTAKKMIFGSITGLILLVGLVAFLSFINPKLAVTKILSIPSIKRIDLFMLPEGEQTTAPTSAGSSHGVPWYFQCSSLGKNTSYDLNGRCGDNSTVCTSGCGLVSTMMAMGKLGTNVGMGTWADKVEVSGGRVCGSGSASAGLIKAANSYGFRGANLNGVSGITEKLNEGHAVIISVRGPCSYTGGGHFIVLTGWREKNNLIADVNDPANSKKKSERTWISLKDFNGCKLNQAFYLYK